MCDAARSMSFKYGPRGSPPSEEEQNARRPTGVKIIVHTE